MNELYSFIVMGISSYSNPLPRNVIVYSAPLSLRLKLIRNLSMALTVSFLMKAPDNYFYQSELRNERTPSKLTGYHNSKSNLFLKCMIDVVKNCLNVFLYTKTLQITPPHQ